MKFGLHVGCAAVVVAVCSMAWLVQTAQAQTFYKWTDERGVVHFSDSPPNEAKRVEERYLPPKSSGSAEEAGAGVGQATLSGTPSPPPNLGPPTIVITTSEVPRTGPSSFRVHGEVKNVGGSAAQQVVVAINAVDAGQGNPCLHTETAVTPPDLGPGQTGNFDTDIESPCLFGDTRPELSPNWQ